MNYMYPDYYKWNARFIGSATMMFFYVYNYQILTYNAHWRVINKLSLFFIFFYTGRNIYHYKKDILRANLFDEYVQLRADELIKEKEPLLKSESNFYFIIFFILEVKRWIWYQMDLEDTLKRVRRQSYLNSGEDFKDAELIMQDFIRRYTDETQTLPITNENAKIGPGSIPL